MAIIDKIKSLFGESSDESTSLSFGPKQNTSEINYPEFKKPPRAVGSGWGADPERWARFVGRDPEDEVSKPKTTLLEEIYAIPSAIKMSFWKKPVAEDVKELESGLSEGESNETTELQTNTVPEPCMSCRVVRTVVPLAVACYCTYDAVNIYRTIPRDRKWLVLQGMVATGCFLMFLVAAVDYRPMKKRYEPGSTYTDMAKEDISDISNVVTKLFKKDD